MPPDESYHCEYARQWDFLTAKYELVLGAEDLGVIEQVLGAASMILFARFRVLPNLNKLIRLRPSGEGVPPRRSRREAHSPACSRA